MPQFRTKILLALIIVTVTFAACKKNFSSDDPLPITYNPSIIVTNDNEFVYALDPSNGSKNWEYHLDFNGIGDKAVSSPLLYHEMVYIFSQRGYIYKLNANTGKLVNTAFLFGFTATPIADGNLIYVPTTYDSLFAIDTGTLAIKWRFGNGTGTAGAFESSPTLFNNNLLFGDDFGKVYSLNKTDGTVNWTFANASGLAFQSSPAATDSFLYIGCNDSNMYSINITSGTLRWKYKTGGRITSSPVAYSGNCIFGGEDFNVYCIDTQSVLPRWIDTTGDRITSSPYVVNQVVYIASYDRKVYALNIIDGSIKWTTPTSPYLYSSSPLVYNGKVYIGGWDNYLYALDTATGNAHWKVNTNGQIKASPVIDDLSGNSYNSSISGYVQ